ncbi:hypothetical protein Tco_0659628 [Tanacetum coccineum]
MHNQWDGTLIFTTGDGGELESLLITLTTLKEEQISLRIIDASTLVARVVLKKGLPKIRGNPKDRQRSQRTNRARKKNVPVSRKHPRRCRVG